MTMSRFTKKAAQVRDKLNQRRFAADRDSEWQRVNSYIADILKDTHVLYAKLARLQGDFAGAELDKLHKISEAVLLLGEEISRFSKDFYEGKYEMQQSEFIYGENGGAPKPNPEAKPEPSESAPPAGGAEPPVPPPPPPPPAEGGADEGGADEEEFEEPETEDYDAGGEGEDEDEGQEQ